ncbi:MAG TPA: PAS domain-containing protein [Streptosporangiaceae bacterium]
MNVDAGHGRSPASTRDSLDLAAWRFGDPGLLDALESVAPDGFDDLGFGLIVMDRDGRVTGYNRAESELAGLPVQEVTGRNFFVEIGPCTNNHLIAQRYRDAEALDEQLDYVFTYRMAPTPVRLRLLARPGSPRQYLAVRLR